MLPVVRCAHCQAAVSEWAARCPACGVSLDGAMPIVEVPAPTGVTPPSPVTPGPDPINRRRAPRWVLGAGAVLVAIAVIVGLVVGSGQTSIRAGGAAVSRPGPALGRYTLIYTGKHGVEVVPLDGQRHRVPLRTEAGPPVQTSAGVAFVRDGTAYLLTPPYDAPPRPLVAADGLFPMVSQDMVGAERGDGPGSRSATYVNLEQTSSAKFPEWSFLPAISRWGNSSPWVPTTFCAAGRLAPAVEPSWAASLGTPPP